MTSGTTFTGIIDCSYPGCPETFVKQKVSDKYCPGHRGHHTAEMIRRIEHDITFVMIDGEGTGEGREHKYVLLGCGDQQLERPGGFTDITEIFTFLYEHFQANPGATYAGYYLGYDFNMWLKLLPRNRAHYLLSSAGKAKRERVCKCRNRNKCKHKRLAPHPVEYKGWQFDILGFKRLRLRPKTCECRTVTCSCKNQAAWMYINDAGSFFQASLLSVIDPAKWTTPIVSAEEYELISRGKASRGSAQLDDSMRLYNRLENEVGARLLTALNQGFASAGIRLNKRQWFGPGQAAQYWLRASGQIEISTERVRKLHKPLREALIATYYGGWF